MICLSEIMQEGWNLIQDGSFESLGLCNAKAGIPLLTFCGNQKYLSRAIKNPDISAIMIPFEMSESENIKSCEKGIIAVHDLRKNFFELHNSLCQGPLSDRYCSSEMPTVIGENCDISPLASIDPVGVTIGKDVIIEAFVRIHSGTVIGDGSIIRSGTVLGGTGLEFIRLDDSILPVIHKGKLIIGRNVEVQYNCNISRSLFPWHETRIGDETKIESLVHIAHGVHIGQRVLIAASACIAGSAVIGSNVWIGPHATVSSEVKISDGARVNLGAVVAGFVAKDKTVTGNFAIPHELFLQDYYAKFGGE